MKYCIIDIESTGLDPQKNGILQVAGLIEIDGILHEPFNYWVRPFTSDKISEEALKVVGVTQDQWKTDEKFLNPGEVFKKFTELLDRYVNKFEKTDKFFFVGYNANFDMQFLRSFWGKNQDNFFGSYFWYPPFDIMSMAVVVLREKRYLMSNFKLETVAKEFGIQEEENGFHDAFFDASVTYEIFKRIMGD